MAEKCGCKLLRACVTVWNFMPLSSKIFVRFPCNRTLTVFPSYSSKIVAQPQLYSTSEMAVKCATALICRDTTALVGRDATLIRPLLLLVATGKPPSLIKKNFEIPSRDRYLRQCFV